MPWWTWSALGVFATGAAGGAAVLAVAVVRAYRRGAATLRLTEEATTDLLGRLEELERRVDRTAAAGAELDAVLAALRRSVARLRVLLGAVANVRTSVAGLVPRR